MRGWIKALVLFSLWLLAAPHSTSGQTTDPETPTGQVVLLDIDGAIGPSTTDYLRRGFAVARDRKASVIVLRIDTPGGLQTAMRDIISDILASDIPVIGFVGPSGARAASAGTYILYASHFAAMAPGTHLGAATPVSIGGAPRPQGRDGKKAEPEVGPREKSVNDAVAYIQSLAALRKRNADWAERAVREAATLTSANALKLGVIEAVSPNVGDLLKQADGRTVETTGGARELRTAGLTVEAVEPNWRERVLAVLTNPSIAYVLLLIGIYAIILEMLTPGTIGPGIFGAIALLTGAYALNLLPINYAGAALLLLGIGLMLAEALLPSFGLLGAGGIAAFALGSFLLVEGDVPGFTLSWPLVALATAASVAFLVIAVRVAWRARQRPVTTGNPSLIGHIGHVVDWGGDQGRIHIQGEHWQARAEQPLSAGQAVRVIAREGLILLVEPEAPLPQAQ